MNQNDATPRRPQAPLLFTTPLLVTLSLLSLSLALALPLLLPHPARAAAEYGPWRSAPIRGGGYLQQVVFAPSDPNRLYMTSDVGGLFRSDDGGKSWRMLHGALPADPGSYGPRGIAVHPKNANRVLIGTGGGWGSVNGVFLSTDGGDSWKQTLQTRFEGNGNYRNAGNVVAISPHEANLVLAGPLGGGLRRSTDGGETWTAVGPDDLSPTHILFDRADARRVWVCALPWGDMKYRRADGSEATGLRGGLFRSDDAGKTWTEVGAESPSEMYQDPKDASVLWGIIRPQQVVRSADGGRTWVRRSEGLAPFGNGDARKDGTYEALAVGPSFLLAGGHGGNIYRLDGDSAQWRKVEWEQVDEGDWWGRMRPNMYRHFGSAMGFIGVNPHDPNHWVFTDWYALYQSRDAGRTWQLTLDGVEMTVQNTVCQEPTDPNVFHAGMADVGYFRSPDGGKTMQWITDGISNNIKCIAATPAQPGRLYATGPKEWQWHANEVFISDDSGRTWRRSGLAGIAGMDARRCETVAPHPAKKDEVWLTVSGAIKPGEGGPYRSVDGGKTWTWEGQGLPAQDRFFRKDYWVAGPEIAVSSDGSLVATSDDTRRLARRGPGDSSWTPLEVPGGGAPNCVAADPLTPGRFYLALQAAGLWRSDDGGRTWKNVVARDIQWVTPDLATKDRVAAITPTGVLVSADAGATWREMDRRLPYRSGRNVVAFAGDRVVVGTGGNGVFVAPLSSLSGAAVSLAAAAPAQPASAPAQDAAADPLPVEVSFRDPALHYQGRFARDENEARCAWPASAVTIRFRGASANVRMGQEGSDRYQVVLDGKPTFVLAPTGGSRLYRLASDLGPGEHTVTLVKRTEAIFGIGTIQGFQLSAGAQTLQALVPARRIEVIGDSISAGYGNEAPDQNQHFKPETENAYLTYGAVAARAVGADYTCIAWSGKKLWPDNTIVELYDRILPQRPQPLWDFAAAPKPDVILVNLGTNDFNGPNPDEEKWVAAYLAFLQRLRAQYPNAYLYCAIGTMMNDGYPAGHQALTTIRRYLKRIEETRRAQGDRRVRVLDFGEQNGADGIGADWHPSVRTHRKMADKFVQALAADLGWSPVAGTVSTAR